MKKLHTRLYDNLDDFDFQIVNFHFLDSNILQLIQYTFQSSLEMLEPVQSIQIVLIAAEF